MATTSTVPVGAPGLSSKGTGSSVIINAAFAYEMAAIPMARETRILVEVFILRGSLRTQTPYALIREVDTGTIHHPVKLKLVVNE